MMLSIAYADGSCDLGSDPRHYWVMEAARVRGCTNRDVGAYTYYAFDGQGISTLYISPINLYNGTVTWVLDNYPEEFELE